MTGIRKWLMLLKWIWEILGIVGREGKEDNREDRRKEMKKKDPKKEVNKKLE